MRYLELIIESCYMLSCVIPEHFQRHYLHVSTSDQSAHVVAVSNGRCVLIKDFTD